MSISRCQVYDPGWKLKCKTKINLGDHNVRCMGSTSGMIYTVSKGSPNCLYAYDSTRQYDVERENYTEMLGIEKELAELVQESLAAVSNPVKNSIKSVVQYELERIEVADIIEVSALIAAEDQNGFYCISRVDDSVWFWSRSEMGYKATVMQQFSPCIAMAISPKANLRISVMRDRNALEIHNSSFTMKKKVYLPDEVGKVNDIICNSQGDILICYGSEHNMYHRVSKLNRAYKIVKSYGDERGSGVDQLNNPCSLALDPKGDVLYVLDKGNGRILALNLENLEFIRIVLDCNSGDLIRPLSIHYSMSTGGELLVADGDVVKIYESKISGCSVSSKITKTSAENRDAICDPVRLVEDMRL